MRQNDTLFYVGAGLIVVVLVGLVVVGTLSGCWERTATIAVEVRWWECLVTVSYDESYMTLCYDILSESWVSCTKWQTVTRYSTVTNGQKLPAGCSPVNIADPNQYQAGDDIDTRISYYVRYHRTEERRPRTATFGLGLWGNLCPGSIVNVKFGLFSHIKEAEVIKRK